MIYNIRITPSGRYYNRYGQRISRSVALMLIECDLAYREAMK